MAKLPKWDDQFTTDPLSDPKYSFHSSYTYNGTSDYIQIIVGGNSVPAPFTLLESNNNTGIVDVDGEFFISPSSGANLIAFRVFGYWWAQWNGGGLYVAEEEKEDILSPINATTADTFAGYVKTIQSQVISGTNNLKWVKTTTDVLFYVDNTLIMTVPAKDSNGDFKFYPVGKSFGGMTNRINRLQVLADSSLPKQAEIREPSIAGSINAAQEIITSVAESRLFVDLGSYSGTITGVSNVVWDPLSAKTGPVNMTEDVGVPDRSGGTTGDFYLEIPANSVAFDYRLVFKEDFVTTNVVATGDAVDFDVDPSPSTQSGTVAEDDDLHIIFSIDDTARLSGADHSLVSELNESIIVHNYNADGNANLLTEGNFSDMFNGLTSSGAEDLIYANTLSFPLILDLDLGKEYRIRRVNTVAQDFGTNPANVTSMDIYSNTAPFSGASLAQGTSEFTSYPVNSKSGSVDDILNHTFLDKAPNLDFTTRYLRLVVVDITYTDVGALPSSGLAWAHEIDVRVNDFNSIDSVNDNAQFELNTGGGFAAYPAGGATQGSGTVRITLPAPLQLSAGDRRFISVKFKADLTD